MFTASFKEDDNYNGTTTGGGGYGTKESISKAGALTPSEAGLLLVVIQGAEDVVGERHSNRYALVIFRGEQKKSKMIKRTSDPMWNEEFQFMLEEPPIGEKIHIKVMSKRTGFGFRLKELLGHVDINLTDIVHNGRINEKYHLINSKNGVIHVEVRWKMV